MKNKFLLIIIIICGISVSSCEVEIEKKNTQPPELIEFLKIEKNKETTVLISDLFFAYQYIIKFRPDKDIKISYNSATKEIKLKPVKNYSGLTFLHFTNNGIHQVLPVIVKMKTPVKLQLTPKKDTKKVYVMGSFNTWNRRSMEMTDKDDDGTFERTLELDDGVYAYQFVTDYGEFPDPNNPEKIDNGYGSYNSVLKVKSKTKGNIPAIYNLQSKNKYEFKFQISSKYPDNVQVHILDDNLFLKNKYYSINNNVVTLHTDHLQDYSRIRIFRLITTYKGQPGNVVTLWTKNGKLLDKNEFIWQDAVVYSLMTDRFCNGNTTNDNPIKHNKLADQANFNGGDFRGLINKIKSMYFQNIGVNTIWISPINKTTDEAFQEWPEPHRWYTGYHGYWPTKPRSVEPRYGSMEEFRKLVNLAHKHDIKILMDYVSNHTHKDHPYFQNHRDWYGKLNLEDGRQNIRLFDEYRLTTWFDEFLPSFDFINSNEAVAAVVDDAIWWLQQTNVDGFRHDATKHVPLKVWRKITSKIKSDIQPNKSIPCYQIGETFGSAELIKSYVNNGMLDSQFNFELFFTQRRVFAENTSDFRDVEMALNKCLDVYGYNHLMGNISDSHDQTRMMALLEGDLTLADDSFERAWDENKIKVDKQSTYKKQKALMTFILTIPGIPIIYYGDEFGMTGANDPDNRRMMRFDNELNEAEKEQLSWNSKIFKLRTKHTSLRRGDYLPLYCDENVMIYSRGDQEERLIIAINKSDKKQFINTDFPKWLSSKSIEEVLLKDSQYDNGKFKLAPYSGNVWRVR